MNYVECPYCEKDDIEVTDYLVDLGTNNEFDCECPSCEEEFEVVVEFEPSFSTNKIVYSDCENCGEASRDIKDGTHLHPFPKTLEGKKLCGKCMQREMLKELGFGG